MIVILSVLRYIASHSGTGLRVSSSRGRYIKWNAGLHYSATGSVHDESLPHGQGRRCDSRRQYVLPDKQHRSESDESHLRLTPRANLESTRVDWYLGLHAFGMGYLSESTTGKLHGCNQKAYPGNKNTCRDLAPRPMPLLVFLIQALLFFTNQDPREFRRSWPNRNG